MFRRYLAVRRAASSPFLERRSLHSAPFQTRAQHQRLFLRTSASPTRRHFASLTSSDISRSEKELEILRGLPAEKREIIFRSLEDFLRIYQPQEVDNINVNNDGVAVEEWMRGLHLHSSSEEALTNEEMELAAEAAFNTTQNAIEDAIKKMSVIFEPAPAIPEGMELSKEAVEDLPSSIELLEQAEEALERRLLDLAAYGLPLQMTTINSRTTRGRESSTQARSHNNEHIDDNVINDNNKNNHNTTAISTITTNNSHTVNNHNNNPHVSSGAEVENSSQVRGTSPELWLKAVSLEAQAEIDKIRIAIREAALAAAAAEAAVRRLKEIAALISRGRREAYRSGGAGGGIGEGGRAEGGIGGAGGNEAAHNENANLHKRFNEDEDILEMVFEDIFQPSDSGADVNATLRRGRNESDFQVKKAPWHLLPSTPATPSDGARFSNDQLRFIDANKETLCTKHLAQYSAYGLTRTQDVGDVEAGGSLSLDAVDKTTYEDSIQGNAICAVSKSGFSLSSTPISATSTSETSETAMSAAAISTGVTPTSETPEGAKSILIFIDEDEFEMEEAEKKANNDNDNNDKDNSNNNNKNNDHENNSNKNKNSNDKNNQNSNNSLDVAVYKGRIVRNQEYGMQDMELKIHRMRKPNSDLSWYRT